MAIRIDRAQAEELNAVRALLLEQRLPLDGLHDQAGTVLVARLDDRIVGSAALELYPDGALLRSVAVAAPLQGQGVGRNLTAAALRLAGELRVPAVYLLTTTAERYFPKFGFEVISRDDVPASVQGSIEFQSACPASATVMRARLDHPGSGSSSQKNRRT